MASRLQDLIFFNGEREKKVGFDREIKPPFLHDAAHYNSVPVILHRPNKTNKIYIVLLPARELF